MKTITVTFRESKYRCFEEVYGMDMVEIFRNMANVECIIDNQTGEYLIHR